MFAEAGEGEEFVVTKYRMANTNLRTQLLRIIKRTGLKPWPKLFQNLRSTLERDYQKAAAVPAGGALQKAVHGALRNAVQPPAAPHRQTPPSPKQNAVSHGKNGGDGVPMSATGGVVREVLMGYTGPEHPSKSSGNTPVSKQPDADSDAVGAIDPVLASIIAAWPTLPTSTREAIAAMMRLKPKEDL